MLRVLLLGQPLHGVGGCAASCTSFSRGYLPRGSFPSLSQSSLCPAGRKAPSLPSHDPCATAIIPSVVLLGWSLVDWILLNLALFRRKTFWFQR